MKMLKISKPNCGPCTNVANYLHELGISYEELDIKHDPSLIEKYDLSGVPVVILMDDEGKEVYRVSGFDPEEIDTVVKIYNQSK